MFQTYELAMERTERQEFADNFVHYQIKEENRIAPRQRPMELVAKDNAYMRGFMVSRPKDSMQPLDELGGRSVREILILAYVATQRASKELGETGVDETGLKEVLARTKV